MIRRKQPKLELISPEEAARISREMAERFGCPRRAVSAKNILNYAATFRHLFAISFSDVSHKPKVRGIRAKAWKNHVEGRLSLGCPIFEVNEEYSQGGGSSRL